MTKSIFIACLSILTFSSCSFQQIDKEAPTINVVKTGQKFRINLPENHTSGYTWQLPKPEDFDHISYINSVWHGNEKGVDYNFEAMSKGKNTLNFSLIKYKDTSAVKQFIVEVEE